MVILIVRGEYEQERRLHLQSASIRSPSSRAHVILHSDRPAGRRSCALGMANLCRDPCWYGRLRAKLSASFCAGQGARDAPVPQGYAADHLGVGSCNTRGHLAMVDTIGSKEDLEPDGSTIRS